MIIDNKRRLAGILAATSALTPIGLAFAQAPAGDETLVLEEIVVTARRESERLLDVPLAITAISAAQIEAKGIRSLGDIAESTPGLTFSNVQGEFLPVPVIRGFAPIDIRGENNAAIFVDGVFVSGREGLNFSQLDTERIEVIKGPQAAMYGRNSFSGAINFVTAKPTNEFKGKATVTVGVDGKRMAQLSVSGPLIGDVLKGRAAVMHDEFDGSYNNHYISANTGGSKIGGYKYETFVGSLLFTPSDKFEGLLSLYVSNDNPYNSAISPVTANCEDRRVRDINLGLTGSAIRSSRLQNFCGEFQGVGKDGLTALTRASGEDRDLVRTSLNLTWNTGFGTIASLTGYSNLNQDFFVDGSRNTGEEVPFAYQTTTVVTTIPGVGQLRPVKIFRTGLLQPGGGSNTKEFSEELRFTSPKEKSLRYSVGVYYYDTKASGGTDGVVASKPLPADFFSFCLACTNFGAGYVDFAAGAGNASFLPWFSGNPFGDSSRDKAYQNTVTATSGFGYVEYDFAQSWTARLEARYTDEEKDNNNIRSVQRFKDSWGLKNWRATLDYKPTPDSTIYGSVASAEKSGGFSTGTVQFLSAPNTNVGYGRPFDPEKNEAYELGAKAKMLNGRVQVEADVYYNKWKNIVIPQILTALENPATGQLENIRTPTAFNANAGDATVKGAEFSVSAVLTADLQANLGFSYIDANYDRAVVSSFIDFPTFAAPGMVQGDVSGNKILRQSKTQGNVGLDYKHAIANERAFFARAEYTFRGKQFADATNQAIIPSMKRLNASFGIEGEKWSLEVWGKNLTNQDDPTDAYRDVYFTNALPNGTFTGGTFFPWRYSVSYPTLRTYGVTYRLKF